MALEGGGKKGVYGEKISRAGAIQMRWLYRIVANP